MRRQVVEDGLWGLLVGDAVGVPYEFHPAALIPPSAGMVPPSGFPRSYAHVPLGTWSDDGAQALCLASSLASRGCWDPDDFSKNLLAWSSRGEFAVDGVVFDIGIQTGEALARLSRGVPPHLAGLNGERNNGNGSLMRTLPLALFADADNPGLVELAHAQSAITHSHPRSQACCALYALWARAEIQRLPDAFSHAASSLLSIYSPSCPQRKELISTILPAQNLPPGGSGYVVDSLMSALHACRGSSYEEINRRAIALGNDTDTTACIAGGIAGIRHGAASIPPEWFSLLRGKEIVQRILDRAFPTTK